MPRLVFVCLDLYLGGLDLFGSVWTCILDVWICLGVSRLVFGMAGLVLGCLDLYFGCLDLFLGVWTCILGVWTCVCVSGLVVSES